MIDAKRLLAVVEQIAPVSLAESWDNCGLLLDCGGETRAVLFALDVTPETIFEAERLGCGILVSHHPAIRDPQSTFAATDNIVLAARRGISLIAAHTCYDTAPGGVNDVLAGLLELTDIEPFENMGRVGNLTNVQLERDFILYISNRLGGAALTVVESGRKIRRVAVVGGSGASFIMPAAEAGIDALVTGEIKHHDGLTAKAAGICVVAAGHFNTENPSMEHLCERIAALLGPSVSCILSRENTDPFTYYK